MKKAHLTVYVNDPVLGNEKTPDGPLKMTYPCNRLGIDDSTTKMMGFRGGILNEIEKMVAEEGITALGIMEIDVAAKKRGQHEASSDVMTMDGVKPMYMIETTEEMMVHLDVSVENRLEGLQEVHPELNVIQI